MLLVDVILYNNYLVSLFCIYLYQISKFFLYSNNKSILINNQLIWYDYNRILLTLYYNLDNKGYKILLNDSFFFDIRVHLQNSEVVGSNTDNSAKIRV